LDADTTIIGAGPYGLSIAAHLRAAGLPFELLGSPLESWRVYMPAGMKLKSERFASNLWDPHRRFTLKRYSEEHGIHYQPVADPLTLETFCKYGDWFRENAVGNHRDVRVSELRRIPGGFNLKLSDGSSFTSRRVVMATGHLYFRVLPAELQSLPEPLALHCARIGDVRQYQGKSVCIIGAGQSALETAAILNENGARVTMLVRRDRIAWNEQSRQRSLLSRIIRPEAGVASGYQSLAVSELPRLYRFLFAPEKRHRHVALSYGPSGSYWLRDRVINRVDVRLGTRLIAATPNADGRVRLEIDGPKGREELLTDHVVAATGYKVDIDRIEYLEPSLARSIVREVNGIPALDSRFGTSVPGLSIVGIASAPVFGPIMRFMYGAKHVAPVVTARLKSAA
jgi:FAD-dependent urate hydroxylase